VESPYPCPKAATRNLFLIPTIRNKFGLVLLCHKAGPQESKAPEVREEAYREDDFPLVEEDCVRDHLSDLDAHKSMGPNGTHP